MDLTAIPLPGARVLYIGTMRLNPTDGEGPEIRALLSVGWREDPRILDGAISLPVEVLSEVVEALTEIQTQMSHGGNDGTDTSGRR